MKKALVTALTVAAVALQFAIGVAAAAEQPRPTVRLWIFDAQIRSIVPGIDAALNLSQEQWQKLARAYRLAQGTDAVALANMVLQDREASLVKRQAASAVLKQAQAQFRAASRALFTEEQAKLIDAVYAAYGEVAKAAQQQMVERVKTDFTKRLDGLLSPEQKKAVESARSKAAEEQESQEKGNAGDTKPE